MKKNKHFYPTSHTPSDEQIQKDKPEVEKYINSKKVTILPAARLASDVNFLFEKQLKSLI